MVGTQGRGKLRESQEEGKRREREEEGDGEEGPILLSKVRIFFPDWFHLLLEFPPLPRGAIS